MTRNSFISREGRGGVLRSGKFELAYRIEGEGNPLLVIGDTTYYPRTFSNALRKRLKLVFAEHRGFAKADEAAEGADGALELVLQDIERIRQAAGVGRTAVLGHSGHGYMALEYAKRFPESVSHVVMVATGPSHSQRHMAAGERAWEESVCPERRARLEADMAGLEAEIAADPERRFVAFCVRMGARSWYDPTFDARPLWAGVHPNMPVIDQLWGQEFRDIDIRRGLDKLKVPVLLVLGRFDYLVAPHWTWDEYRADFNDLTVRLFEKSSHTPQFEEPNAFDDLLVTWLADRR